MKGDDTKNSHNQQNKGVNLNEIWTDRKRKGNRIHWIANGAFNRITENILTTFSIHTYVSDIACVFFNDLLFLSYSLPTC